MCYIYTYSAVHEVVLQVDKARSWDHVELEFADVVQDVLAHTLVESGQIDDTK